MREVGQAAGPGSRNGTGGRLAAGGQTNVAAETPKDSDHSDWRAWMRHETGLAEAQLTVLRPANGRGRRVAHAGPSMEMIPSFVFAF
jgi:hypothetical protein